MTIHFTWIANILAINSFELCSFACLFCFRFPRGRLACHQFSQNGELFQLSQVTDKIDAVSDEKLSCFTRWNSG